MLDPVQLHTGVFVPTRERCEYVRVTRLGRIAPDVGGEATTVITPAAPTSTEVTYSLGCSNTLTA